MAAVLTPRIGKAMAAAVTRGNEKNGQDNRLYDQAIEAFEASPQWAAGHTIVLLDGYLRGKRTIVSLRNQGGYIALMILVNGKTQYTNQYLVGYNDPNTGWQLSREATLINFNVWQRRCRRELSRLEDKGAI